MAKESEASQAQAERKHRHQAGPAAVVERPAEAAALVALPEGPLGADGARTDPADQAPAEPGPESLIDGGLAWSWAGGRKIRRLGKPVGARKLVAPDEPASRREYEADD